MGRISRAARHHPRRAVLEVCLNNISAALLFPLVLYSNTMKSFVVAVILVLAFPTSALACSYDVQHRSFRSLHNHSDLVFEGEVTAVYIGGKQVSTSMFDDAVARLWKDTDILFKIKPTKMIVGQTAEQFEVWGHYTKPITSCGGGLNSHVRATTWGANEVGGKLVVAPFYNYLQALNTIQEYQNTLTRLLKSSSTPTSLVGLIDRELVALEAILADKLPSPGAAFFSTPKERADMPSSLFDARMEFLTADYELERELLIMQTAQIMRHQAKEAE